MNEPIGFLEMSRAPKNANRKNLGATKVKLI